MSSELITRLRAYARASGGAFMPASAFLEAADEIQRLDAECTRLAQRNTMLVNELSDRGRQFTPSQLKRINSMAIELYKGEG